MSDDFIKHGIDKDRYLKADKLVTRFEKEIFDEIHEVFDQFVEKHTNIFFEGSDPIENTNPTYGLATHTTIRIDYIMNRKGIKKDRNIRLCAGFEIVDPAKQDEEPLPGRSFSYVFYKIKHLSEEDYVKVMNMTDNDGIKFGKEMWRPAPGIFYIPVNTGDDVRKGLVTLREHFSKFSDHYGEKS
ncbi:MAG: hypothetical protein ACOC85_05385 [Thermoplasmatota archaeon]